MAWFKVHSDDLHEEKPVEKLEETGIKTRDVMLYVAEYSIDYRAAYYRGMDRAVFIRGEVITRTNARDAFMKGVEALMAEKGFDPTERYDIKVTAKTVKEPV